MSLTSSEVRSPSRRSFSIINPNAPNAPRLCDHMSSCSRRVVRVATVTGVLVVLLPLCSAFIPPEDGAWFATLRVERSSAPAKGGPHAAGCSVFLDHVEPLEAVHRDVLSNWANLGPSSPTTVLASFNTSFWDLAPFRDSSTHSMVADQHGQLVVASGGPTASRRHAAYSFVDPRLHRLHDRHHDDDRSVPRPIDPPPAMSGAGLRHGHDRTVLLASASEVLWIPGWAEQLDVYCSDTATFAASGERKRHSVAARKPAVQLNLRAEALRRTFGAQQAAAVSDNREFRSLNAAGPPERQYNVVFLSAGFQLSQKEMFFKNASDINDLMQDPFLNANLPADKDDALFNMHRSTPFNRYWPFFNVYAVFEPSVDVGASRPLVKLTVNNNLGCQHPAEMERAVTCDIAKATALVTVSPAPIKADPDRVIIIVIVNTNIYGGSARYDPGKLHLGHFFNNFDLGEADQRRRMLSLVDHEIGHAFGNLMDEYSIGVAEPKERNLSNCEFSAPNAGPPSAVRWNHWRDLRRQAGTVATFQKLYSNDLRGTINWDVLSVPEAVCGFTNYYKANSNCMMQRLNDYFMCPVCREAATLSVFKKTFELTWPRRPLFDMTLLVPKQRPANGTSVDGTVWFGSSVTVHLPAILTPSNGFTVVFRDHDGTLLPNLATLECPCCVRLNQSHFVKYPVGVVVRIKVDVTDSTMNFVSPVKLSDTRNQTIQTTYFQIMVVDAILPDGNASVNGTVVRANYTKDAPRNVYGVDDSDKQGYYYYCASSTPNRTALCSMNFTSRSYEAPLDVGDLLKQYDDFTLAGLGGLALLLIVTWIVAANKFDGKSDGVVRPIFEVKFALYIDIVRRTMQLASVSFLIAAVGTIGVAAYFYFNASTVGRVAIIAGVALALLLYIIAFVGFWAVSSRSKRCLCFNGLALLIGLGSLLFVAVAVKSIGNDLEVIQGMQVSLSNVQGTNVSNVVESFWTSQLETLWTDWTRDSPDRVCAIEGMFKCTGWKTSCASILLSSVNCPRNCQETNSRYDIPCQAVLRGYIVDNYTIITQIVFGCVGLLAGGILLNYVYFCGLWSTKREIQKRNNEQFHKRKSGGAGGRAAGGGGQEEPHESALQCLLRSLDAMSRKRLIEEFKRTDRDGNGELDKVEFFVFCKKALMYSPTTKEIAEIYSIADANGDGTLSLHEFLAVFSTDEPEVIAKEVLETKKPQRQRLLELRKLRGAKGTVAAAEPLVAQPELIAKYVADIVAVRARLNDKLGTLPAAKTPALTVPKAHCDVDDDLL